MIPKRMDRDGCVDRSTDLVAGLAAAETMRSAAESAHVVDNASKKEDEKISVFWRIFGGTILSIVALAAVTLYNSLSTSISELRADLGKEKDARADLVKKDEFNARITNQYERIRAAEGMQNTLTALRGEHDGIKEKLTAAAASVEAFKKDSATMDALKERIANLETIKKDLATLDLVKEKLTALVTDLKSTHDEVNKVALELSQNRAADLERKTFHDSQMKQFEETIKDLSKGVQECREKIARLEGQQPMGATPTTGVKPARFDNSTPMPAKSTNAP